MNPNESRTTPYTETLPTALPYLPPPVRGPLPNTGGYPIKVEQQLAAVHVDTHNSGGCKTRIGGRISVTRVCLALFTLGLSLPFCGIRVKRTIPTRNF